jgi:hypothetical protein
LARRPIPASSRPDPAKSWVTDTEGKIVDRCLQLFGGYGYMDEYPISRLYSDSRVQRICAGTNEIMTLVIARSLYSVTRPSERHREVAIVGDTRRAS